VPVQSERMAAIIEPIKIGGLLRAIDGYRGEPMTRLALRLIPYIFPRPTEFRTMEWAHIDLHGATPEWRVPWRRMKMREPHIVPLSRQAAELLQEIRLFSGNRRWVFPQLRNPDRPMLEGCITAALRTMGFAGTEMSSHGFRSLASRQLYELGWNDQWIETQLAHADRNKVRAAYNHAKYYDGRALRCDRRERRGWIRCGHCNGRRRRRGKIDDPVRRMASGLECRLSTLVSVRSM
jgi:integrase